MRSLSGLIENHLETPIEAHHEKDQLSPKVKKIAGIIRLPIGFDEEKAISAYFQNKH